MGDLKKKEAEELLRGQGGEGKHMICHSLKLWSKRGGATNHVTFTSHWGEVNGRAVWHKENSGEGRPGWHWGNKPEDRERLSRGESGVLEKMREGVEAFLRHRWCCGKKKLLGPCRRPKVMTSKARNGKKKQPPESRDVSTA